MLPWRVERRRIPQAAAGVDARVPPQVLHLVPGPFRRAGGGVQRPQRRLGAAEILAHCRVDRHGRHVHGAVVVAGGHVDALAVVADQRPAPQLPAGGRRQGDGGVVRRRVHHPVDHVDAVGAAVGRAVVVRPQHLAGGELDRHHVRLKILRVHHAIHDDRGRRVAIGQASGTVTPVDSIGTHHATPSVETLELVIALATSRVLARLPPGSVQPAATAGAGDRRAAGLDRRRMLSRATRRTRFGAGRAAADGQASGDGQDHAGYCGPVNAMAHATHLLPGREPAGLCAAGPVPAAIARE